MCGVDKALKIKSLLGKILLGSVGAETWRGGTTGSPATVNLRTTSSGAVPLPGWAGKLLGKASGAFYQSGGCSRIMMLAQTTSLLVTRLAVSPAF